MCPAHNTAVRTELDALDDASSRCASQVATDDALDISMRVFKRLADPDVWEDEAGDEEEVAEHMWGLRIGDGGWEMGDGRWGMGQGV